MSSVLPPGFLPDGHLPSGHVPEDSGGGPTPSAYPAVGSSIRLPGGGVWVVNPASPDFCELIWLDVLPEGLTLSSVSYTFPDGITALAAGINAAGGKSCVAMAGMTHSSMHHIRMLATLSDGSTIGCTAPLRGFNG